MDRRQELLERRTELRFEMTNYTFGGLGIDYMGKRVNDWAKMHRAPLEAELKEIDAELESLGWRRPKSFMYRWARLCLVLAVVTYLADKLS